MHCNTPAVETPTVEAGYPEDELLRMAVYVCMSPRGMAAAEVLPQRRKAYAYRLGTSHWPHDFRLFGMVADMVTDDELDTALSTRFADRPWVRRCHALL